MDDDIAGHEAFRLPRRSQTIGPRGLPRIEANGETGTRQKPVIIDATPTPGIPQDRASSQKRPHAGQEPHSPRMVYLTPSPNRRSS